MGAGNQVTIVNGITYRQRLIPDRLQGRVKVLARMVALAGTPIGALVGGVLSDRSGPRGTVLSAAVLLALAVPVVVRLRRSGS